MKLTFCDTIVINDMNSEHLSTPELKQIIRQKLADKKIWPFPSQADGQDTGYEERANICKKDSNLTKMEKYKSELSWTLWNMLGLASLY